MGYEVENTYRILKKTTLKIDREHRHISFLKMCKREGIIPNFLRIRNRMYNEIYRAQLHGFERKMLGLVIRKKYAQIRNYEKQEIEMHERLGAVAQSEVLFPLLEKLEALREIERRRHEIKHKKKMEFLVGTRHEDRDPPKTELVPFVNYSKCAFTPEELSLLEKGPKFIPHVGETNFEALVPQIESALDSVPFSVRDQARSDIFQSIKGIQKGKKVKSRPYLRLMEDMKKKYDVVFLKTDKTGKLAVLDIAEYKEKMQAFLRENGCVEMKNDPIKTVMSKTNEIINKRIWPMRFGKIEKNRTGVTPSIFGQLKDHKPDMPIRPIVAKCQGVTYPIEKVLATLLKENLPESPFSIRSTEELVGVLKTWKLNENDRLASLDIVALYPSVNTIIARKNFMQCLKESRMYSSDEMMTIESAMNLVVENNCFRFDNKFFRQTKGCPMGSPISGFMAEYILRPMEGKIRRLGRKMPNKCVRFVDDILVVWRGEEKELKEYVDSINASSEDIQFTYEFEKDNRIAFLDVDITRQYDGSLNTKVYRKPLACNPLMPKETCTLKAYKMAGIRSQIKRAQMITKERVDLDSEINKIKALAGEKGYKEREVNDVIRRIKRMRNVGDKEKGDDLKFGGCIEYWPKVTEKVKGIFRKYGIRVAVKPKANIFTRLRNDRDRIDPMEQSGVYEIPFRDTIGHMRSYVGQTIRKIGVRRKEHVGYVANAKDTTELSKLANKEDIQILFDETTRIASFKAQKEGLMREAIEIRKRGRKCIATPSAVLPGVWNGLISRKNGRGKQRANVKCRTNETTRNLMHT